MSAQFSAYPSTMISFMVSLIQSICQSIWSFLQSIFQVKQQIIMDSGKTVSVGKKIAEGGFSFVFECTDAKNNKFALKRMYIGDGEALRDCQREAGVHRSLSHANTMPLLGMCLDKSNRHCYMLFPYMPNSLRSTINKSIFETTPPRKPMDELSALQIFYQVCLGVSHMHDNEMAHCDIKLENVLLESPKRPVLMDFGSAQKPMKVKLDSRRVAMNLAERAAQHTTLPYRPPELLEGNVRSGDSDLDYAKVDVWSLGCTLFAILFGVSPYECEFRSHGEMRVVDCTSLKILGEPPFPPMHSRMGDWYSKDILNLIRKMLTQDRVLRPTLDDCMISLEQQIEKLGGQVPKNQSRSPDDNDDLDALLSSSRFV